jgi:hypothetical protein
MKKINLMPIDSSISIFESTKYYTLNQIGNANTGVVLESQNYILNFIIGEFTIESIENILTQ